MATSPQIRNIVATYHLGCQLDLNDIEAKVPLTLYTPKLFSGLLLRVLQPYKAHCQLYKNGKMTVNGARTLRSARRLARRFCSLLCDIGYPAVISDFKVVNMVACCNFGHRLRLELLSKKLGVLYHPDIFPGLSVRLDGCTAVLFHSGKANFLGAKTKLDIDAAYLDLLLQL